MAIIDLPLNQNTLIMKRIISIVGFLVAIISCQEEKLLPLSNNASNSTLSNGSPSASSLLFGPVINSFTPSSGVAGITVTIFGSGFGSGIVNNQVTFSCSSLSPFCRVQATLLSASRTRIIVILPATAVTGRIIVKSFLPPFLSGTATSPTDFIVGDGSATITTLLPAYGLPGNAITINGTNFLNGGHVVNSVKFNGVDASFTTVTDTQIKAIVPAGATTGPVSVNVSGVILTSAGDFEILKDIPRDGLIALYPFKGNANDVSGNNLNGTVSEAVLAVDRFGKPGQSYNFDGINDYISMGNPTLLQISNKITISGWANINTFNSPPNPGQGAMAIITKLFFDPAVGGNPRKGYHIDQDFFGDGTPSLSTNIYASSGSTITSYLGLYVGGPVTQGSWIFFSLVIVNNNWKFYRDGVLTNEGTASVNVMDDGSLGDLTIGTYGGGFHFNGRIDDVAIYNRGLTAAEIQQLYQQTITKY